MPVASLPPHCIALEVVPSFKRSISRSSEDSEKYAANLLKNDAEGALRSLSLAPKRPTAAALMNATALPSGMLESKIFGEVIIRVTSFAIGLSWTKARPES